MGKLFNCFFWCCSVVLRVRFGTAMYARIEFLEISVLVSRKLLKCQKQVSNDVYRVKN